MVIYITDSIQIDDTELKFEFIRSAGPGGQNINKVSTAVQLRFDINNSKSLEAGTKIRLLKLSGNRATSDGILIIEAKKFRSQEKNRLDAISRLIDLIKNANLKPKSRIKTRPSLTASAARVDEKKRRGIVKKTRLYSEEEWD
jgi:ribosome-associated protein